MGHWISDSMIHKGNRPPPPPVLYLQGLNQNQNLPRPAEAKFYYLHYLLSSDHNYSWNELLTGNKIQLFCVQHQIRLMESRRMTRSNFSAGKSQLLLPTWCSHPNRVILILTKFGILISTWFQVVPFGLRFSKQFLFLMYEYDPFFCCL